MDKEKMNLMILQSSTLRATVVDFLAANGFEKQGEDLAKTAQVEILQRQKAQIEAAILAAQTATAK